MEVEYWGTLTARGKERRSERGGGGGKGLYCSAVSWQMKRTVICRKHLFSSRSFPPTNNGHKTNVSFKERPDTVTLYLIVGFNPRDSNTFFVQIRGVENLRCALESHRGEFCVEREKCSVCLLLFFNLNFE